MFRCRGSNSGAPNLQSGLIHYGIYYALHYAPNKAERQQILLVPSKVGQARVEIQHDNLLLLVSVCLVIYFFLEECLCYKYIILKSKGYYLLVNTCALLPPYRYKIFGKALARIQSDSQVFGDHVILLQVVLLSLSNYFYIFCQVTGRIGHPITGYGQETRNRAARQRIPNKIWTDEDGVEHVEVAYTLVSAQCLLPLCRLLARVYCRQIQKGTTLLVTIVLSVVQAFWETALGILQCLSSI